MKEIENNIECTKCHGEGDYSVFAEFSSETKKGICNYCMDLIWQPDQQSEVQS